MKLFEYQAKEAFREKGLPTPKGVLVRGMDELDGRICGGRISVRTQVAGAERRRGKAGSSRS